MLKFKQFIAEDNAQKEICDMWSSNKDISDIEKTTGKSKKYIKQVLKRAGKKGWESINEADETKLDTGKVKEINKLLFGLVKSSKADIDIKNILQPVEEILSQYGVDKDINVDRVITNKGEKEFKCNPFTNVILIVKWTKDKEEFQLTDAYLENI